jgi:hypothetical protein
MNVGKPAPPRPRRPEPFISSTTCSGWSGAQHLRQRRVAVARDVFLDPLRIDAPAVAQHDLGLLREERNVLFLRLRLAAGLVVGDQPVHDAPADEMLADDFRGVFRLHALVKRAVAEAQHGPAHARPHAARRAHRHVSANPAAASSFLNASAISGAPEARQLPPMQIRTSCAAFSVLRN